jgi:predicted CoA-binding protein
MPVNADELLKAAKSVLVIDWPSEDVPESLARAGLHVVVRGGPGPADYAVWEWEGERIVKRPLGRAPEEVDVVYSYRPLNELPGIVDLARALHARTVWTQSGVSAEGSKDSRGCWLSAADLESARALVEAAGMTHFATPYIVDCLRSDR